MAERLLNAFGVFTRLQDDAFYVDVPPADLLEGLLGDVAHRPCPKPIMAAILAQRDRRSRS